MRMTNSPNPDFSELNDVQLFVPDDPMTLNWTSNQ